MSKSQHVATAQLAVRLGVTPRHVARLVAAGVLEPAYQLPGSRGAYVFDAEYVEQFVEKRRAEREQREAS